MSHPFCKQSTYRVNSTIPTIIHICIIVKRNPLLQIGFGSLVGLFVESHDAHAREDPSASSGQNLVVGEGNPLLNLRFGIDAHATAEKR